MHSDSASTAGFTHEPKLKPFSMAAVYNDAPPRKIMPRRVVGRDVLRSAWLGSTVGLPRSAAGIYPGDFDNKPDRDT